MLRLLIDIFRGGGTGLMQETLTKPHPDGSSNWLSDNLKKMRGLDRLRGISVIRKYINIYFSLRVLSHIFPIFPL